MTYLASKRINPHDLEMVAYNSNARVRARNAVYAVDTAMQTNYAALKAGLTQQLRPVIIVNNGPNGGTYTLIHGDLQETTDPISPIFQMVKSICHTPLGIYVLIAPYLLQPSATEWVLPLSQFRAILVNAGLNVDAADFPGSANQASKTILEGGIRFIDESIHAGAFSIESFQKFTTSVSDAIKTNMNCAAEMQVLGVETLIKRWKTKLSEVEWENLYVVVLAIWTTSERNQNAIILRPLMSQKNVESHLITISTAETPDDPISVALDNLARIVQDNIAAEMVFPIDPVLADSLKGPDDLLSGAIEKALHCPHHKR